MKTRLLALLLVLAIAPGVSEVIELVAHYAAYGDVADRADDRHGDAHPLGADEHGCSGLFHLCSCHCGTVAMTSPPSTTSVAANVTVPPPTLAPPTLHGLVAPAPDLRPPIA